MGMGRGDLQEAGAEGDQSVWRAGAAKQQLTPPPRCRLWPGILTGVPAIARDIGERACARARACACE